MWDIHKRILKAKLPDSGHGNSYLALKSQQSFGVESDQAQISDHAAGCVQGKTRTPNQSRMVGTPVPDPWKPWPSIQRPAWKRVPFLVDGPIVSAAGYLSLSNYGSGLLLPACWWVMERAGRGEHWTGQRRVICGPGALSSAHAHLSCWGRGEWAGGWGVCRAGRSWAENSLRLLPILRHFTLCFTTILERRRLGDVKYDRSLDGCSFSSPGKAVFVFVSLRNTMMCWSVDFTWRAGQDVCVFFSEAVHQRRVKSIIPSPSRWPFVFVP